MQGLAVSGLGVEWKYFSSAGGYLTLDLGIEKKNFATGLICSVLLFRLQQIMLDRCTVVWLFVEIISTQEDHSAEE